MKFTIEFIDHKDQVYPTCGDYAQEENGDIRIVVSKMPDERLGWLVGIHELAEIMLMKNAGIPLQASTDYDIPFEEARKNGWDGLDPGDIPFNYVPDVTPFKFRKRMYRPDAEPGDAPDSPYQQQHNFATAIERMMCAALGIKWATYTDEVDKLFE